GRGRHSYGSERRDSRSEASSGMSPSCSERWTVLFGMTSTQRCSRHVRRSACGPTPKSQNVVLDDSQIASTAIECGEGFQISGCWWVTGDSEVIRFHTKRALSKCEAVLIGLACTLPCPHE